MSAAEILATEGFVVACGLEPKRIGDIVYLSADGIPGRTPAVVREEVTREFHQAFARRYGLGYVPTGHYHYKVVLE